MARLLQLQIQRKPQKTLKRESVASGLRKAIVVVVTLALGKPLTLKPTEDLGTNPEIDDHALRLEDLLLVVMVEGADRILLEKVTKTVIGLLRLRSNQNEERLHQAEKVQSFAISFAKANARTEISVIFGTHRFAEMNPPQADVN